MVLFTTSRYASKETVAFAKTKGEYLNRGKKTVDDLVNYARKKGEESIVLIEEKDKKPFLMVFIEVSEDGKWKWTKKVQIDEN